MPFDYLMWYEAEGRFWCEWGRNQPNTRNTEAVEETHNWHIPFHSIVKLVKFSSHWLSIEEAKRMNESDCIDRTFNVRLR